MYVHVHACQVPYVCDEDLVYQWVCLYTFMPPRCPACTWEMRAVDLVVRRGLRTMFRREVRAPTTCVNYIHSHTLAPQVPNVRIGDLMDQGDLYNVQNKAASLVKGLGALLEKLEAFPLSNSVLRKRIEGILSCGAPAQRAPSAAAAATSSATPADDGSQQQQQLDSPASRGGEDDGGGVEGGGQLESICQVLYKCYRLLCWLLDYAGLLVCWWWVCGARRS